MNDLIQRLRTEECSWCFPCNECKALNAEAAAEIERLRSLLGRVPHEKAFGGIGDCYPNCLRCEIDRMLEGYPSKEELATWVVTSRPPDYLADRPDKE